MARATEAQTSTIVPAAGAAEGHPCADWPWYGRSGDPEALLPQLLALPASRVAYQMSPVWWEYFALDCQRVMRHLEQERLALRRAGFPREGGHG